MSERREAQRILDLAGGDAFRAVGLLESQMNVLHQRGQVVMSLAGVVITVTGFSGRIIAATGPVARGAIVAGLGVVLVAAVWVFLGVMRVKWISADLVEQDDVVEALARVIARRDRKTRAYVRGGLILCLGFAIYGVSIALMLLTSSSQVVGR